MIETREVEEALAAPFEDGEVKFKPAVVTGNRALALPYVDARAIEDRLDEVLGVAGWQDEYEFLPDGSCVCRLRLKINGEWITKMDVGGQSEQPDEGDRRKAAVSDALKRAAVKFGVARYLYRLEPIWCDYDTQKKRFAKPPQLPRATAKPPAILPAKVPAPAQKPAPQLPATGAELKARLEAYESRLVAQTLCSSGELLTHVLTEGVHAGQPRDMTTWSASGIALAVEVTKAFEAACAARKARPQLKAV